MQVDRRSLAVVFTLAVAPSTLAQCPTWQGPFGVGGMNQPVYAFAEFDDGTGTALYAAGAFTQTYPTFTKRVARWDGAQWSQVGNGPEAGEVYALCVYDDGQGPALYAGGTFVFANGAPARGIAKWDGAAWSPVGGGIGDASSFSIRALEVFDIGGGPELYATGHFRTIGGLDTFSTARWNGASWNYVGGGIGDYSTGYALEVFDDGSGPALYVGGFFDHAGQVVTSNLARWSAQGWSAVGNVGSYGGADLVRALRVFDDGVASSLVVAGHFASAGGATVRDFARWDGSAWSAMSTAPLFSSSGARALEVFDEGQGAQLYSVGERSGGRAGLVRWNGASWDALETPAEPYAYFDDGGHALLSHDDGSGPALYVGGEFAAAGGVVNRNVARWRGGAFDAIGTNRPLDDDVWALLAVDEPQLGAGLYAGGAFDETGSGTIASLARWDGSEWTQVGGGVVGDVRALTLYDDGSGAALYAAGKLVEAGGVPVQRIARWDGTQWSPLGAGIGTGSWEEVWALCVFDDGSGPKLIAGGLFDRAGGTSVHSIASWDGTSWSPLADGIEDVWNTNGYVFSLAVFDDGSGPALYAGGAFDHSSPIHVRNLAKWDGVSWSRVGADGVDGSVHALEVFDDGSGPALYVGGYLTAVDGLPVKSIARWNGAAWSDVGGGFGGGPAPTVFALHGRDDGTRRVLYAAGDFADAGGAMAKRVARWDGISWSSAGSDIPVQFGSVAYALASFDDGSSAWPQLFVGGSFAMAGGTSSWRIARMSDPCVGQGASYCTAGTTSNGCMPTIASTGYASASATSGFTIAVTNLEGQKQGHIFYGLNGSLANPWSPMSTSYLCVKAPTQRTGTQDSGGNAGACNGSIALDWNAYVASHPSALGAPFAAGTQVWAQLYFRDPPAPKTTNLSDALHFIVTP